MSSPPDSPSEATPQTLAGPAAPPRERTHREALDAAPSQATAIGAPDPEECVKLPSATAALYATYGEFKDWRSGFRHTPDEAADFAGELRGIELAGQRVLELGFGRGALQSYARARGAETTGLEIQPDFAELGRRAGYRVFEGRVEDVPELRGERFDVILAFDVFEHVPPAALPALLARLHDLLAEGGRLVARFPNGQSPFGRVFQYADATHCNVLSVASLTQIAQPLGFALERGGNAWRSRTGGPAKRLAKLGQRLTASALAAAITFAHGLRRTPLDPNVTVVLRRASDA